MTVTCLSSVALEVPDLDEGIKFYSDAGLEMKRDGNKVKFHCSGQPNDCIVLVGGAPKKRIHHLELGAENIDAMRAGIEENGGTIVSPPTGFASNGLWFKDPHGMLIHLIPTPDMAPLKEGPVFEMNAPGRIVRDGVAKVRPQGEYPPVKPLRLGHALFFTPDVTRSIEFFSKALGFGLADHSADIVAFMCTRKNSDHHVVAFAKSPDIGFHHVSFQVGDPDEVGRAGRDLLEKSGRGDWGFGRHTVGSNFFHYIEDPWGSWFEYYCDIDYISDYNKWTPTDYPPEDALANWGPKMPDYFVKNAECEEAA